MAWGTIESNRFGTHEFLQYVDMLGTEPYICVNLGTGTWTEAQQWVEYCNFAGDTGVTRIRKQNGRAQPWKVTHWGLGNEIDGPWQMGHRSADDYGKFALEAAKLMKLTDPTIKLIAAGSSNYGAGSIGPDGIEPFSSTYAATPIIFRCTCTSAIRPTTSASLWRARWNWMSAPKPPKGSSARRFRARLATAASTSPGMNGTFGIEPAEPINADVIFWRSITIWKTRWWSPPS